MGRRGREGARGGAKVREGTGWSTMVVVGHDHAAGDREEAHSWAMSDRLRQVYVVRSARRHTHLFVGISHP